MNKEEFIDFVLSGGSESDASSPAAAVRPSAGPAGFAGKGFTRPTTKPSAPADRQATFAKRLLQAAGFETPQEVARTSLVRGDDAAARYLPDRVFYWPKTANRPYQTLLFESEQTNAQLLAIPAFKGRAMSHLDIVEDALARFVQQALRGFERGGEGVTADIKKGRQDETLCIVSVVDQREEPSARLVCFGTVNAATGGLETFHITERTRSWEPQLAREYLGHLYQRQFSQLDGSDWQEAFTTSEERKKAQKLLEVCTRPHPKEADIQSGVLDLLDEIARSFGLRKKPNASHRLQWTELPEDHDIGMDADARTGGSGTKNPFRGVAIQDEKNRLLGYIVYCLDRKKDADQLRRRLEEHNRFHNVLVVYPDGDETVLELWQGRDLLEGKLRKDGAKFVGDGEVVNLLSRYFVVSKSKVRDPEGLAEELAYRARYLRTLALRQLEGEDDKGPLKKLYHAFRDALIHEQTQDEFADSYAQTLTYGLLTARWVSKDEYAQSGERFTRQNAVDHLQVSHGFLRDFYRSALRAAANQSRLVWLLDDIANLLDRISIDDVFSSKAQTEDDPWSGDPVVHFYEPFLNKYDAATRQRRGVYYTPRPVVSYIVRSVHELLQNEFGLTDGLADTTTWGEMVNKYPGLELPPLTDEPGEKRTVSPDEPFVQILDPATGTATFVVEVIEVIHRTLSAKWKKHRLTDAQQRAAWNDYVPQHLLPRLHAFELMMAPYAIAHMKIGLKLAETGYRFGTKERARIFLTNALEPSVRQLPLIGFDALAREAAAVNEIKRHKRFTVVIGNPPYSKSSGNRSEAAEQLVQEYKDMVVGEINVQPLSDDYVKFIGYALKASVNNSSVVAMITNRSFLDGLIHRGLRNALLTSCCRISILDLHGDSNVGENVPDGRSNDNVFDITQGVAISIFVRKSHSLPLESVAHNDVWGTRAEKYKQLANCDRKPDCEISASPPYFFFVPKDLTSQSEQVGWISVNKLFVSSGMGVKSRRDHFLIDQDYDTLRRRFQALIEAEDIEAARAELNVTDNEQWTLARIRDLVRRVGVENGIHPIAYRPFDIRFIWYHREAIERGDSRWPVMKHVLPHRLSLLTSRQSTNADFTSVFIARGLSEMKTAESTRGSYAFPLFTASNENELLPDADCKTNMRLELFAPHLRTKTSAEILNYVYAVLHSPSYRRRYAGALRIEFPKVPGSVPTVLFDRLSKLGGELIALHLLESPKIDQALTDLIGSPNVEVKRISWSKNTAWLDKARGIGFKGVGEDVWNFHIGGYQVCERWLKYRKGRALTNEEIAHFQKIVVAISETIRIMAEIDDVIDAHGGWPLK